MLATVDSGSKSLNGIRAVVGKRTVDVPQTLGCDVISHAGLGRAVVDVACDAMSPNNPRTQRGWGRSGRKRESKHHTHENFIIPSEYIMYTS